MFTLISLSSRQIWPQVLSVLHVKPDNLVLLHSSEAAESRRPAERLKYFLESSGLMKPDSVCLSLIPHDDFSGAREAIADFAALHSLDESNCLMNLTGGNKLMAMAAAEWCRISPARCFYLERNFKVFPFHPVGTDLMPQADFKLDPHLARDLDPLALLRCQIENAEIVNPGQSLTLSPAGRAARDSELQTLLKNSFDFRKYLLCDVDEPDSRVGDGLEYATAFALLKLGVPKVQRSIRLSPRFLRGLGHEEGELDLVFNWAGKLWVVDCKDRKDAENRMDQIRTEILSQITLTSRLNQLLNSLADELRERDLKPLKEDLLIASEVAGLLGRAVAVRRASLPAQAMEFAQSRNLSVILKDSLLSGLRLQLYPSSSESLATTSYPPTNF